VPALPRFNFTVPVLQVLADTARPVHKIAPTASAQRAAVNMLKYRINSLVVTDEAGLAGIITERDFLKLKPDLGAGRSTQVSQLMTPVSQLTTVPSSFTVQKCVQTMRAVKVRNLPVVEHDDVKAVLSMRDISRQIFAAMTKQRGLEAALTVGDLLSDPRVSTPNIGDISLSSKASVADAIQRMREERSGSLLLRISGAQFGLFTERDFVQNVVAFDEEPLEAIAVESVARFTAGASKAMMRAVAENPSIDLAYRPAALTCVESKTRVRDCLSLMLGQGLLYVPVTEQKAPVNVISMRDINLFLAPES